MNLSTRTPPSFLASRAEREQLLRNSVEQLYRVFRSYRLAAHIDPDPCFPNCCDDRPLRAVPLHQLPPEAFRMYQWKAITTWGSVGDFKHFLPRLLELIAWRERSGDGAHVDPFFVFEKMKYGRWQEWPAHEREAIASFLEAWWMWNLCERDVYSLYRIDSQLRDAAELYHDISPLIAQWEQAMRQPECCVVAALNLASLIDECRLPKIGRLGWNDHTIAQEDQMLAWLAAPETLQLLEGAFFSAVDPDDSWQLSMAHQLLTSHQAMRSRPNSP